MKAQKVVLFLIIFLFGCTSQDRTKNTPYEEVTDLEVIHRLSTMAPGFPDPLQQGQYPNLSQTIRGVTVTIDWLYANDQNVYIGYHFQGLKDRRYFIPSANPVIEGEGKLKLSRGSGATDSADLIKLDLPIGYGAGLEGYELAHTKNKPEKIDLLLSLEVEQIPPEALKPPRFDIQGWFSNLIGKAPNKSQVEIIVVDQNRQVGPFLFTITIPVE